MNFRFPVCTLVAGQKIEKVTIIQDLAHLGLYTVDKQLFGLLKMAAEVGSDNYPEIVAHYFLINAPGFF